jgi:AcrR family transcriptional regulator
MGRLIRWPPDIRPLSGPAGDETWERLRQATIDLAIERGYHGFEVAHIVQRARVTHREFEARFRDRQDCCDRTYEANIADFDRALVVPYLRAASWREGIRAAAYGAVEYLRDHRRERRYGELRKQEAEPMAQVARDVYLQRTVDLIDVGRCELSDPESVGRSTAEGALGSIHGLLVNRLHEHGEEGMTWEIFDDVLYLAMRPYLGHAAARREASTSADRRVVGV